MTWVIVERREIWIQPVAVHVPDDSVDPLKVAQQMVAEGKGVDWEGALEYSYSEGVTDWSYLATDTDDAAKFVEQLDKDEDFNP